MDYIIPSDTRLIKPEELPKQLEIFEAAKVMLRSNIDVTKGLVMLLDLSPK